MKNLFISALVALGTIVGTVATSACAFLMFDEPEMPESLK